MTNIWFNIAFLHHEVFENSEKSLEAHLLFFSPLIETFWICESQAW